MFYPCKQKNIYILVTHTMHTQWMEIRARIANNKEQAQPATEENENITPISMLNEEPEKKKEEDNQTTYKDAQPLTQACSLWQCLTQRTTVVCAAKKDLLVYKYYAYNNDDKKLWKISLYIGIRKKALPYMLCVCYMEYNETYEE